MTKLQIFLFLVMYIITGCQNKADRIMNEKLQEKARVEEQNKELAKTMFEAWSKGDYDKFQNFISDDYKFHFPSDYINTVSKSQLIESAKKLRTGFPDLHFTMGNIFADENNVIFTFVQYGTQDGEYMGIAPTGKSVKCSGILISRFNNGKVVEQWEEFNMSGLMQQLGMEYTMRNKQN